MTHPSHLTFLEEMKKIANVQLSQSRVQDKNNARDAWQVANTGIYKTAKSIIHKKKVEKVEKKKKKVEKVEKKKKKVENKKEDHNKHAESDFLPAPTWEQCMAFCFSCSGVGPTTPEMFK